mgnify:FL=1
MKKQNLILSAALAAVFSASTAFAEAEVTGKIVHESAKFTTSGDTIGTSSYTNAGTGYFATTSPHGKDAFKTETSARIFIDGEAEAMQEGATYHVELNLMRDSKGIDKYDGNESYTQRDALREAYVDATADDWSIRAGKQQVVWGTADGMKLLDMINPSDYGEMAQNQMEDSRIPVWMVNAETTQADGSEIQVVVSQPRENVFAGLNRDVNTAVRANDTTKTVVGGVDYGFIDRTLKGGHNTGNAFIMKGVDSITGQRFGFVEIVPDLGTVARGFASGFGGIGELSASGMGAFTVDAFEDMSMGGNTANGNGSYSMPFSMDNFDTNGAAAGGVVPMVCAGDGVNTSTCTVSTAVLNTDYATGKANSWDYTTLPDSFQGTIKNVGIALNAITGTGTGIDPYQISGVNVGDGTAAHQDFIDLMNAVSGKQMLESGFAPGANTELANYGSDTAKTATIKDSVFDYMGGTTFKTFDAFINAKSQYVYDMPENSEIDLATRYKNTTADGVNYSLNASYNYDKNPIIDLGWYNDAGAALTVSEVPSGMGTTNVSIADANGVAYGGVAEKIPTLRFTQRVKRVKNLGGSFDMAVETAALGPVVIRGEALYTKDSYSPIMDKDKLWIGNLVGALKMEKGDRFKYVLGADITVLTNMMVSAQFIQDRNLDFVDGAEKYTADYATMHMTNGFNKATKDKNFYSLFLSKPFGASGEHRWNNIIMIEDTDTSGGSGKWNRLDAEFSIDDDTQATVEYNKYWGDENTQFGQLEKSSNIQVGVKYSF